MVALADGSCCPAISLELRSLTTAALPQHHHRAASSSSACQLYPCHQSRACSFLRRVVLLLALSAPPTPSQLRAPPPRRSTRHARPGIVGTSRTYTPLQERDPTTPHGIDSPSIVSYRAACIDVLVCWPHRHRPAPTHFRRGTITPGAATAIDAVCIAHSQWRTQTQNPSSRRSRSPAGMRKP